METVLDPSPDEYDGTGSQRAVFPVDPDLASTVEHIVYFVLRVRPLRVICSNCQFVDSCAQRSHVEELQKKSIGAATLLQEVR
jgi:hypothetical protein